MNLFALNLLVISEIIDLKLLSSYIIQLVIILSSLENSLSLYLLYYAEEVALPDLSVLSVLLYIIVLKFYNYMHSWYLLPATGIAAL